MFIVNTIESRHCRTEHANEMSILATKESEKVAADMASDIQSVKTQSTKRQAVSPSAVKTGAAPASNKKRYET
jgi:hypothetical protein